MVDLTLLKREIKGKAHFSGVAEDPPLKRGDAPRDSG
jgi:hypothetical protein